MGWSLSPQICAAGRLRWPLGLGGTGAEVYDLLSAWHSGNGGFITVQASDAHEAVEKVVFRASEDPRIQLKIEEEDFDVEAWVHSIVRYRVKASISGIEFAALPDREHAGKIAIDAIQRARRRGDPP